MKTFARRALVAALFAAATPALAQVTFYEREAFEGHSFTTQKGVSNFERYGFNDRAASVVVTSDRWEACSDARYHGECRVLRPGRYPSLAAMGLDSSISSVRKVDSRDTVAQERYAPAPLVTGDYRRRNNERVYDAQVTGVRAVVGTGEQRCWVEHEQASADHNQGNIVGGLAGAVIGGILGHQVGSGRGNDLATVGGAVAGGAIGMNIARDHQGQPTYTKDVQHCRAVPSHAEAEYWDVTYSFRGREHEMQTATRPGATVRVNEQGEPRA
jgi:uncharacterized protein YcfJ